MLTDISSAADSPALEVSNFCSAELTFIPGAEDSCEEKLVVNKDGRVVWMLGGLSHMEVDVDGPVSQIIWAQFARFCIGNFACVLTSKSIWLLSLSGISHHKALPTKIISIWPINGDGVILTGCEPSEVFILQHPFQPFGRRTFNQNGFQTFDARKIIWSGFEQNLLATHNLEDGFLQLWSYGNFACDGEKSTMSTFEQGSCNKRMLRLSTGGLSPAAFQPKLRSKTDSKSSWKTSLSSTVAVDILLQAWVPFSAGRCEGYCYQGSGHWQLHLFNPISGTVAFLKISKDLDHASLLGILQDVQTIIPITTRQLESDTNAALTLVKFKSGQSSLYHGFRCLGNVALPLSLLANYSSIYPRLGKRAECQSASSTTALPKADPGAALFSDGQFGTVLPDTFPFIGWASSSLLMASLERVDVDNDATDSGLFISTLCIPEVSRCLDELLFVYQHFFEPSALGSRTTKTAECFWSLFARTLSSCPSRRLRILSSLIAGKQASLRAQGLSRKNLIDSRLLNMMRIECSLHTLRFLESDFFRTLLELTWSKSQWIEAACLDETSSLVMGLIQQHRNSSLQCLPRSKLFASCYEAMRQYIERSLKENEKVLGQHFHSESWCCIKPWSTGDLELFPKDLCNFLLWTVEKSGEKFSGSRNFLCRLGIIKSTIVRGKPIKSLQNNGERNAQAFSLLERMDLPYVSFFMRLRRQLTHHHSVDCAGLLIEEDGQFYCDQLLIEVNDLLRSDIPRLVKRTSGDISDHPDYIKKKLLLLGMRTAALPFGRGAFTLGTHRALPTEPVRVPNLCFSAKVADRNYALVRLEDHLSELGMSTEEFLMWPEFHNGVAAGLRLAAKGKLARTWVVYNCPPVPTNTHAGLLFGLGLSGHLSCLAMTDLYRYLSQEHELTLIGLLMGISAAKRMSMDSQISRMLHLHLTNRYPAGYPDLEISMTVQTSAIIGLGLLYQESGSRPMMEMLLNEIVRFSGAIRVFPKSAQSHQQVMSNEYEAYTLAAGIAYGLVGLGQGSRIMSENVEHFMRHLIVGGVNDCMAEDSDSILKQIRTFANIKVHNIEGSRTPGVEINESVTTRGGGQVVSQGSQMDFNVTSPAAIYALGLVYLQTNEERIANAFHIPENVYELTLINPKNLSMSIMMRSLVMWDDIDPSEAWVTAQLPAILRIQFSTFVSNSLSFTADEQTIIHAHFHSLSGAILALGIRYAGTGSKDATETIKHFLQYFLSAKKTSPEPRTGPSLINREILENGVCVAALAMSTVMAGTCNVDVLKLLRALQKRLSPPSTLFSPSSSGTSLNYGSYAAVSLALGLLFLGEGRLQLSRDLSSAAFLAIALYPCFEKLPKDRRYYLQALRHFYVLAAEEKQGVTKKDLEINLENHLGLLKCFGSLKEFYLLLSH